MEINGKQRLRPTSRLIICIVRLIIRLSKYHQSVAKIINITFEAEIYLYLKKRNEFGQDIWNEAQRFLHFTDILCPGYRVLHCIIDTYLNLMSSWYSDIVSMHAGFSPYIIGVYVYVVYLIWQFVWHILKQYVTFCWCLYN